MKWSWSAHDDAELAVLRAVTQHPPAAGQGELDLRSERTGPAAQSAGGPVPITSSLMGSPPEIVLLGEAVQQGDPGAIVMRRGRHRRPGGR